MQKKNHIFLVWKTFCSKQLLRSPVYKFKLQETLPVFQMLPPDSSACVRILL